MIYTATNTHTQKQLHSRDPHFEANLQVDAWRAHWFPTELVTCLGKGGGGRLTPSQPGQLYQGWTKAQSMHVHLCTRFCRCSFLVTYQLPQKGTDRKGGERGGERQTEIQREKTHLVLGFEHPVNHTGSPQDERVRDKLGGETEWLSFITQG